MRARTPGGGRRAARFARRAALVLGTWLLAAPAARACQACFGAEETQMVHGSRMGAWFLIGLTFCMEAAFVGFFIYLWRRARRARSHALDSEWRALQRNTRLT